MKMHYMQRIDDKLSDLPWYVTEFIDSKNESYLQRHFLIIAMITLSFLIGL